MKDVLSLKVIYFILNVHIVFAKSDEMICLHLVACMMHFRYYYLSLVLVLSNPED